MLRTLRAHLTYANVMSTIAVFLVLAGASAFAAVNLKKNSVNTNKIKNGQVKNADLGNSAVTSGKLADGAVTNGKLGDGSVTGGKLGNEAVTTSKLANNAVTTGKLGNEAVATGKLGNEVVIAGKLATNAVTTGKIAKDAVTNDKLAADSVSGLIQIVDGTVTGSDIIENSLTFGCVPLLPVGGINHGPSQIPNGGFCAVMRQGTNTNWTQAASFCGEVLPDSTLPTAAQIAELGDLIGEPYVALTAWTAEAAVAGAGSEAWAVQLGNAGQFAQFLSVPVTTNLTDVICTYDPASKNG